MEKRACEDELVSLMQHKVWEVEVPPKGTKVVRSKWIFKKKLNAMGLVEQYKARLVAKGFTQQSGVDYDEVWAPVGKHATLRTLLAVAAAKNLELHQMDVKTAFLHDELDEDIWMQPPEGYVLGAQGAVCRLRKSIHGLKQACRAWHPKLKSVVGKEHLLPSQADPGLFARRDKEGFVYVLVWVDDLFIVDPRSLVDQVRGAVATAFEAVDLGEPNWFLGMEIRRDRAQGLIRWSQTNLIRTMLGRFGLSDCRSVCTPLDPGAMLQKDGTALDDECPSYAEMVGCLLYVAVCSRPDIQFAASALARYMSCPTKELVKHAVHVFRYLAGTVELALEFQGKGQPVCYVDADYGGDAATRRSTTGYAFMLFGACVSWQSRLQRTVATSITEVEYMAACTSTREALWMKILCADLGLPLTCVHMLCDNQACIKIIKNPISSAKSKHIDIQHHFVRERVAKGEVGFEYCMTQNMLADVLTKPVSRVVLARLRSQLGVR
jgi:hypothetical protein